MINIYTVDRIEDNFIILEDRKNNKIFDVEKELFKYDVREGDIVDYVDNQYIKNVELTNNIKKGIRSRFDKLKK